MTFDDWWGAYPTQEDYEANCRDAYQAGAASRDAEVAKAFESGRQAEREECLNICINHASDYAVFNCEPYESMEQGALSCALTIRARGDRK